MIIEAQDDFKNWLSAILRPMCEADPAALAKYVIALIKKDKSDEELQKTMKDQLLVFLDDETESFVHQVFDTLKSKEYMTTPVIPNANPPNPNSMKPIKEKEYGKETKIPITVTGTGTCTGTGTTELGAPIVPASESVNGSKREAEIKRDREFRKNDDKEEKPRHRSRHRSLSRNRSRSRSRSWERARRSRSKEKVRDQEVLHPREIREKRIRSWRNKSPPRRYDRRRSRSPSPGSRLPRSRSPSRHRGNRAGGYRRSASRSRSRSPLLEKRERRDSLKEREGSRPSSPLPQDGVTHSDQALGSLGVGRTAPPSIQGGKRRCRDYDERGYCMRGEMCPFDHGVDPVVLEDSALTRVLAYNPDEPPVMAPVVPVHPLAGPRPPPPEYNPQAPQMWGPPGRYRGPRPLNMHRIPPQMSIFPPGPPSMQRELIPIPVMDNRKPDGQFMHDVQFNKKKAFDYGRLGPGRPKPSGPAVNCSLELKKVPVVMNSIAHLNNHFSKFGKIVNIRVQCDGDPEAAVVTFSSHAEANAAYRSTEAVLNNRFIKVFWHNHGNNNNNSSESKQENIPPQQRSIKDRLGNSISINVPPNINKVLNLVQPSPSLDTQVPAVPGEEATLPPAIKEENSKAQEAAAIVKGQELLAAKEKIKKTHEEKKKEMLQVNRDLRKRKQELLEKQLSQQKVLIEKMEKLPAGTQRDTLKSTIMKIQESIETIKRDLEKAAAQAGTKGVPMLPKKKSKEETQKEMLDIELDLISKQQEGVDTTELQRKILELKQRAAGGLRVTRGRKYGPLVSRHLLKKNNLEGLKTNPLKVQNKAVLGASFQKHAVDHRPTGLLVSGYEADEQEAVITFFKQFGEIVNQHLDSTLPSVIFKYKTRKEAEVALLKGKHFQDRTLSVTWCNGPPSGVKHSTVSESDEEHLIGQSILDGDEELGIEISEEVLLHDDEEEDEENEDRSWRR